ncbi:MAG TPA: LytR C-terminal domain-containing protein [Acidimicrobiia bacterium]|nr:LytR C-terminal domain-containing protein [Acidimicrobiia bacterium]
MTSPGPPVGLDTQPPTPEAPSAPPSGSRELVDGREALARRGGPMIVTPTPDTARRRRVIARRRLVGAVGGVVVLAVVVGVIAPVRDRLSDLVPSTRDGVAAPSASSVLLAWPTSGGGASIVMLGAPGLTQGSALLIPGNTQVEVPSFGSATLASALRSGGPDTLDLAVENALGYDTGEVVGLAAENLAALLGVVGPLNVRLRAPVVVGDRSYPAATVRLTADEAATLAATRSDDSTEIDHLAVVHAVLEGWLDALDAAEVDAVSRLLHDQVRIDDARVERIAAVLTSLISRHVAFDTLEVIPLGVPDERYRIDGDAADDELAVLLPGLAFSSTGARVRVEILNGTGTAGIATEAARRLIPEGAEVVLMGNASSFGVRETLLVLQTASAEADARRFAGALGVGDIRMARNPLGVADVSIVLGADFDPGGE